jgi:acyl carrier protein
MEEIMEKILEILEELHSDIDFMEEEKLVDNKVLDSFDLVTLVTELSDAFDIEITAKDFVPDNFNSVKSMYAMVERLMEE